jgi:hypothetical protein
MTGLKFKKILLCGAVAAVSLFVLPLAALGYSGDGLGDENYPFRITDCDELQEISDDLDAYYILMNDIDCVDSTTWNEGQGYIPPINFTGSFDGRNNTIDNLFADYETNNDGGLIGSADGATIKNIHLTNADFTYGNGRTGGIVGAATNGTAISGVSFSGDISANLVGGLVGFLDESSIERSYAEGSVTATTGYAGGLVGFLFDSYVSDSYTTVDVIGGGRSGGFASSVSVGGTGFTVNIERSYAAGSINASNYRAAFAGESSDGGDGGGVVNITDTISAAAFDTNKATNYLSSTVGTPSAPVYNNAVYDNTRANNDDFTNQCDSYGADAECVDVDYTTLFNTSAVAPFFDGVQVWDFTNIWQVEAAGLPTLRATTLTALNDLGAPDVPINLATSSLAYEDVILEWEAPELIGGYALTNYVINYREVGAGSWTELDTGSVAISQWIGGLTNATDYEFRVAAGNSQGVGEFSEIETFTTLTAGVPGVPDELEVDSVGLDFAELDWVSPDLDGGSDVTNYVLNYREVGSGSWSEINTADDDSDYNLDELEQSTNYEFRVAAVNIVGQGEFSEVETFTTTTPVEISTCDELQSISEGSNTGYYLLTQDIDCSSVNENGFFIPIDFGEGYFEGTLDGQGHSITNLSINGDHLGEFIPSLGLFTITGAASVKDLAIVDAVIDADGEDVIYVGILAGVSLSTYIDQVSVTGTIDSGYFDCDAEFGCAIGGMIGLSVGSFEDEDPVFIYDSYARVDLTLHETAEEEFEGGIGGFTGLSFITGFINTYSEGSIASVGLIDLDEGVSTFVGGHVGLGQNNLYQGSFTTVELEESVIDTFSDEVGGFVGIDENATFDNSYWFDYYTPLYEGAPPCHLDEGEGGEDECILIDSSLDYFKSSSNEPLVNWDFDEIWEIDAEINDGFPILQYLEVEEDVEEEPSVGSSSTGSRSIASKLAFETATDTSTETGPTSSTNFSFSDTPNHWGENYADKLKEKCDVFGYQNELGQYLKTFGPDNAITRAELVRMLIACKKVDGLEFEQVFPDVNEADWFGIYITYAYNQGWIQGYDDGEFKPNQEITRAEAIKIILLSHYSAEDIIGQEANFSDVDISAWYAEFVSFAETLGFVSGYTNENGEKTGEFKPENSITRAESAKIISLVLGL